MTNTKLFMLSYGAAVLIFLTLDFIWLSLTASRLYKPMLSTHLAGTFDWKAVAIFYLIYFIGVTFFVVHPTQADDPLWSALRGILFGVIAYGAYDLTNQATLSNWPWMLSVIDMTWGGFATGCAACGARIVLNKIIGA